MQEFDQWIMPSPALAVWRVATGLDFSPLAWRVYDKDMERGELAIRLWRPRVWDASGPEAAALGTMGSEYKAAAGWIKASDLAGSSCYLLGLAASADDWDQVSAGWWKLIRAVADLPAGAVMLGAAWCTKDAMLDRETVDQNVEPVFKHQAEFLERVTLRRSTYEDGRIQYDMFKKLIGSAPPGYKPGESVPCVPGGALVQLQLIRLGDHRTRIDAWAKGVNRELDNSWLPNIIERFVLYLHHMAGVPDTADAPTGGATVGERYMGGELLAEVRKWQRLRVLLLYEVYYYWARYRGRSWPIDGLTNYIAADIDHVRQYLTGSESGVIRYDDLRMAAADLEHDGLATVSNARGGAFRLDLTHEGRQYVEELTVTRGGPDEGARLADSLVWVAEHWSTAAPATAAPAPVAAIADGERIGRGPVGDEAGAGLSRPLRVLVEVERDFLARGWDLGRGAVAAEMAERGVRNPQGGVYSVEHISRLRGQLKALNKSV